MGLEMDLPKDSPWKKFETEGKAHPEQALKKGGLGTFLFVVILFGAGGATAGFLLAYLGYDVDLKDKDYLLGLTVMTIAGALIGIGAAIYYWFTSIKKS